MTESAIEANDAALQKVNELNNLLRQKAWSEHSREGFVSALEQSIGLLADLKDLLKKIEKELGEDASASIKSHLAEMEKEIAVFKRNLDLEKKKTPLADDFLKPIASNEQYAWIEQKISSTLLRTRYLLERMQLQAKKHASLPLQEKSTARNLLELLKQKESEIESLKFKYEDARKHALTGMALLEDSAGIENEMNSLARKLGVQQNNLEKAYFESKKGLEEMQRGNLLLRKEVREQQQLLENYLSKNFELITLLKKERDYAKRIVLDIEHETLQLRSAYSKELLSLEEAKIAAKREAEERFIERIKKLEKETAQQHNLTEQLQSMLQNTEARAKELEEKNQKLRLLLKAKEKHDIVKKAFKARAKQSTNAEE